jgi:hypothetical protein
MRAHCFGLAPDVAAFGERPVACFEIPVPDAIHASSFAVGLIFPLPHIMKVLPLDTGLASFLAGLLGHWGWREIFNVNVFVLAVVIIVVVGTLVMILDGW